MNEQDRDFGYRGWADTFDPPLSEREQELTKLAWDEAWDDAWQAAQETCEERVARNILQTAAKTGIDAAIERDLAREREAALRAQVARLEKDLAASREANQVVWEIVDLWIADLSTVWEHAHSLLCDQPPGPPRHAGACRFPPSVRLEQHWAALAAAQPPAVQGGASER